MSNYWIDRNWLGTTNTVIKKFWFSQYWLENLEYSNVKGYFRYVDLDGNLEECNNTRKIPFQISELVTFNPDYPEPPHTEKDHQYLESLQDVFQEIFNRIT